MDDEISTQPSEKVSVGRFLVSSTVVIETKKNISFFKVPTGRDYKMVQNMMQKTEKDIDLTNQSINAKLAQINNEILLSSSRSTFTA